MAKNIFIGTLSAKVDANAGPYLAAMQNVRKETAATAKNMDGTWERFKKGFTKKWNAKSFGTQVAKGIGLGSGFGLVNKAADSISAPWEKAAELAKFVEESTAKQFELSKQAMAARRTDLQQQLVLETEIARTYRELQGVKAKPFDFDFTKPGEWGDHMTAWLSGMNVSPEQQKRINELTIALQELGKAKSELDEKIKKSKEAQNLGWVQALQSGQARRFAADRALMETQGEPGIDDPAYRERMMNQYWKERAFYLTQIARLGPTNAKNTEEKARFENHFADATERLVPLLERENQLAKQIGESFAESFEEAAFSGEKLSDVLKNLAQDVARLIFRETITGPLASFITGMISPIKPAGKAIGGPVTAGSPYVVGEHGPELFVPNTSGRIDSRGGKGGGGTYFIDARGADRTGLANLEAAIVSLHGSIEQRAVAAVIDAQRRRLITA